MKKPRYPRSISQRECLRIKSWLDETLIKPAGAEHINLYLPLHVPPYYTLSIQAGSGFRSSPATNQSPPSAYASFEVRIYYQRGEKQKPLDPFRDGRYRGCDWAYYWRFRDETYQPVGSEVPYSFLPRIVNDLTRYAAWWGGWLVSFDAVRRRHIYEVIR